MAVFNALRGELGLSALNIATGPFGLGVGLLAGELPKSKSQIEYEGYTSGQQGSIDQAYGPGGIMEGYNAVSAFGKGPVATMKDRYNERTSNGIFDETTKKLEKHIKDLDPGFKGKTEGDVDDDPTGDAQVAEDTYAEETGIDLTDFGFEDLKGGGADMGATGPTGSTGLTGPTGPTGTFDGTTFNATTASIDGLYVGDGATNTSAATDTIRCEGDIIAFYSSDMVLKENINPISNALDKVSKIGGYTFDWTKEHLSKFGEEDSYFNRKNDVGVMAQEIQEVLPEVVAERKDKTLAVKYDKLVPLLIESIKELKTELDELKSSKI